MCVSLGLEVQRDNGLKLFLEKDDLERLYDFEEECVEGFFHEQEIILNQSTDERVKNTTERVETMSQKIEDINQKENIQTATVQVRKHTLPHTHTPHTLQLTAKPSSLCVGLLCKFCISFHIDLGFIRIDSAQIENVHKMLSSNCSCTRSWPFCMPHTHTHTHDTRLQGQHT